MERSSTAGRFRVVSVVACTLGGLISPLATRAQVVGDPRIEPAAPSACDAVTLVVERAFASDCGWLVDPEISVDGDRIDVSLALRAAGVICLPVARIIEFRFPMGVLAQGEYTAVIDWVDLDRAPERLAFRVAPAGPECLRPGFVLGDANGDERVDIADPVAVLNSLFLDLGVELPCRAAADANRSSVVDLSDAVFTLSILFLGREAPAGFGACVAVEEALLPCEVSTCEVAGGSDELVWVARPDGCVQCEVCAAPSLDESLEELLAARIGVFDSREVFIPVCEACTVCASGRLYAALIDADDAEAAAELRWVLTDLPDVPDRREP